MGHFELPPARSPGCDDLIETHGFRTPARIGSQRLSEPFERLRRSMNVAAENEIRLVCFDPVREHITRLLSLGKLRKAGRIVVKTDPECFWIIRLEFGSLQERCQRNIPLNLLIFEVQAYDPMGAVHQDDFLAVSPWNAGDDYFFLRSIEQLGLSVPGVVQLLAAEPVDVVVEGRQPVFMVAGTDSHVDFLALCFCDEVLQGYIRAADPLGASFSFEVAQINLRSGRSTRGSVSWSGHSLQIPNPRADLPDG